MDRIGRFFSRIKTWIKPEPPREPPNAYQLLWRNKLPDIKAFEELTFYNSYVNAISKTPIPRNVQEFYPEYQYERHLRDQCDK